MAKLLWTLSAGVREHELTDDVVLGRSTAADVVVEDETVSRRHARILASGAGWSIEDLGSGNGIVINGVLLHGQSPLADGDEITLGRVQIAFRSTEDTLPSVVFNEGAGERLRSIDSPATHDTQPQDSDTLSTAARLKKIAHVASSISQARSESELFTLVADRLFDIFPQCERVCIVLVDQDSGDLRPRLARSRSGAAEQIPVSRTILDEVIRERRTVHTIDAAADDRFSGSGTVMQFSLRTLVCAPMISGERVIGALQVDGSDPGRPFSEDDLATILVIAAQTALATANNRTTQALASQSLLTQDLALAKRIQTHFLPQQPPTLPRYSFDTFYAPALAIGGDYYDFVRLDDKHHAIFIGDVSGKGISAALYMSRLAGEVRTQCAGKTDAGEILRRVNKAMVRELTEGMFVTLLLMVLNTEKDDLQVASAGHMSPIVRKPSGEVMPLLVAQNEPIGMPNYGGFEQEKFKLDPGDIITAFTDGISEAMNEKRGLFGEQRLFYALENVSAPTPASVKKAVLASVDSFVLGAAQSDDIALICFGRE